jgi:hypoxanthine-guanine phosphoribosyltransferase
MAPEVIRQKNFVPHFFKIEIVELHKILKEAGASDVKICTLLLKPNAYKKEINIDYAALSIPDDFIVGYGLDYNDLGRQYKDLYVIDQQ